MEGALSTGYSAIDADHGGLLRTEINLLLCSAPYPKTAFLAQVVSQTLNDGGSVFYIDLDTTFTVYLRHGVHKVPQGENLSIFNPNVLELDETIAKICSVNHPDLKLIVFDSVNMFYHLFDRGYTFSGLNRYLSVCLSLLKDLSRRVGAAVVVCSLPVARKAVSQGHYSWVLSHPGGRVLKLKSELIMSIDGADRELVVEMVKFPGRKGNGAKLRLPYGELLKGKQGETERNSYRE